MIISDVAFPTFSSQDWTEPSTPAFFEGKALQIDLEEPIWPISRYSCQLLPTLLADTAAFATVDQLADDIVSTVGVNFIIQVHVNDYRCHNWLVLVLV